jgi:hypothetical protein
MIVEQFARIKDFMGLKGKFKYFAWLWALTRENASCRLKGETECMSAF